MFENVKQAAKYIQSKIRQQPEIGIVLGSGLGAVAEHVIDATIIPYQEIPGFPVSTVSGHAGRFIFGTLQNKSVVLMQGRVHFYEGYPMEQVVMPIRTMGLLGIHSLLLTNAAGGIREDLEPGTIMILKDHISSFVPSPLLGKNDPAFGVRFPDMTQVYDREYIQILEEVMTASGLEPKTGIYLQTTGPAYETPAEIQMYKLLGADAVGMSTACEAIAAAHMGIKVAGLSTICNKAAGLGGLLNHNEILNLSNEMSEKVNQILNRFLTKLPDMAGRK